MKNIIRICNLIVRFSKFTFNMEIYEKFVEFFSKLIWRKTLFAQKTLLSSLEKNFVHPKNPTLSYFFIYHVCTPTKRNVFLGMMRIYFWKGCSCKGLYGSCLAWRPWTFKAQLSGPWERSQDLCLSHRLLISLSLSLSLYIYIFIYLQAKFKESQIRILIGVQLCTMCHF